jgi:hypothetical protein
MIKANFDKPFGLNFPNAVGCFGAVQVGPHLIEACRPVYCSGARNGDHNAKARLDCFRRVACWRLDDPNGRSSHASRPQGSARDRFIDQAASRRLWFRAFGSAGGHRDQKLRYRLLLSGLTPGCSSRQHVADPTADQLAFFARSDVRQDRPRHHQPERFDPVGRTLNTITIRSRDIAHKAQALWRIRLLPQLSDVLFGKAVAQLRQLWRSRHRRHQPHFRQETGRKPAQTWSPRSPVGRTASLAAHYVACISIVTVLRYDTVLPAKFHFGEVILGK